MAAFFKPIVFFIHESIVAEYFNLYLLRIDQLNVILYLGRYAEQLRLNFC